MKNIKFKSKRVKSKNSSLNFVNSIKGFIPVYADSNDIDSEVTHYDVCFQSQSVSVGSLRKNARTVFVSISCEDMHAILEHLELDIESDFDTIGVNEDFYCLLNESEEVQPIKQSRLHGLTVNIGGSAQTFSSTNEIQVFQELTAGYEYRVYELKNGEFQGMWACSDEMLNASGVHCIAKNDNVQPLYISLRAMWTDTIIDGNRVGDNRPNSQIVDGKRIVIDGGGLPWGDETVNEACQKFMDAEEVAGFKYLKEVIPASKIVDLYLDLGIYPKNLLRCANDSVFSEEENTYIIDAVQSWLEESDDEEPTEDANEDATKDKK